MKTKMKKKYLLFIFLGFVCCTETEPGRSLVLLPDPVPISGKVYDQDIIAQIPSQIELVDNNLFLFRTMRLVAKGIDKTTGEATVDLPFIGDAPEEFITPYFAGSSPEDSTFYIADATYRVMRKYEWKINEGMFTFDLLSEKKRDNQNIPYYVVNRMENGCFIALANAENLQNPLVLLDADLNEISLFGEMFEDAETLNPNLYHGALASYKNQLVYAMIDFGYLVSYSVSDDMEITKEWEHFFSPFFFTYKHGKAKIDMDRNLRGFYDVKMTEKYIYCLYSGELFDWNSPRDILPNKVLVFKHDGTLVKNFLIDKEAVRIAVDDDSTLYVSSISPDSGIAFYNINDK